MTRISLFIVIFLAAEIAVAQNILEDPHSENDTLPHYPDDQRPVIPTDVGPDLDASFPKPGSLFGTVVPSKYFNWKKDLYAKVGLKLGISYQTMFMGVPQSQAKTDTSTNSGMGGWFLLEAQWKLFNRDKDFEGSIVGALDWRHVYGEDNLMPGELFAPIGSGTGLDASYFPWDPYMIVLFWEQQFKKDRLWIRIGQIATPAVLDFFRFKDPRVSYTGPAFNLPVHVIPYSPPALGLAFNWHPVKDSELYIAGAVNDLNIDAGEFDWSGLFEYGEVFAGLEVGNHWRRGPGDFDHAHLMVFYADKKSSAGVEIEDTFIPFPTEAGWGFKIHGTKQWNKLVTYANYTYNTAQGGGFGIFTNTQNSISAGMSYLKPFDVQGEISLGINWSDPMQNRVDMINDPQNLSELLLSQVYTEARSEAQFSFEAYWRLLVLKQLWITPGAQFIVNPTFNLNTDFIFVPHIKARVYF